MVAKSGCRVRGQMQVKSGHSIAISKSRCGCGLGKVSSRLLGLVAISNHLNAARILFQLFAWLEEKAMRTGSYGLALCFYFVFILFCFVPSLELIFLVKPVFLYQPKTSCRYEVRDR